MRVTKEGKKKGISYGPNIDAIVRQNRDWEEWAMNEVVSNPRRYRKGGGLTLPPLYNKKK
jgi:cytochrome c2